MSIENRIKRLTLRASIDAQSGYGFMSVQTCKHLREKGVFTSIRPMSIDEKFGSSLPAEMVAAIVRQQQPEEFELFQYTPTDVPTPGKKTIYQTMWEATELPLVNVSLLNRAECVIVPSEWGKKSFESSGVTKPIHVIPLGYDPDDFWATPISEKGPTIFGVAGRVQHCARRKMIQEAVDLFIDTFKGNNTVRLECKIHPDDPINDPKDKRVRIIRDVLEPHALGHWLRGLTCFISLARGEGFALWPLQAMACGRPVLAIRYSGQADYLNDANSFIVKHREIPADGVGAANVGYAGFWGDADLKHAAQLMQIVAKNRVYAVERGKIAEESVRALTWKNYADKLIAVLESTGAI